MEDPKLIKSLHPCRLISILAFFMTNIVYTSSFDANNKILNQQIIADLPGETDFPPYFLALQKGIEFCVAHKYYVDMNMQFGLFLVEMNLRQFLEKHRPELRPGTRTRLETLFKQIDELADYYSSMLEKHKDDPKIVQNKKLALLFYETWPEPPDPFNTDMLNRTRILTPEQLVTIYDKWENYHYNVYDIEENRPTPLEADECIALLVQSDIRYVSLRIQPNCGMSLQCKRVILGENQFGYGLTHRLLLLAIARFSERCTVFTPKVDRFKTMTYCKKCFNEAEYIAFNNFRLPDLMFEQIAVCGLFGHAQFIRKYWLNTLLRFQTTPGCFSEKLATGNFDEHKLKEDSNKEWIIDRPTDIIYGECNIHFTAVSMVSLSHSLRYILETNYKNKNKSLLYKIKNKLN